MIPVKVKALERNSGQMACLTDSPGDSDTRSQGGHHIAFAIQVPNVQERRGGYRLTALQSPTSLWFQLVAPELLKAGRTLSLGSGGPPASGEKRQPWIQQ